MPQNGPYRYTGSRKKRKRRQQLISLLILLGLVVVLLVVALLVGNRPQEGPSSSLPASSAAPPVAVASSSSKPEPEPEPLGPYDEEAIPPLFNADRFVPDDYQLDLIEVGGGHQMQRNAGEAYLAMFEAAKADGVSLNPVSGYRSHQQQTNNYNNAIQRYRDQGLSEEEALRRTRRYYAIPGSSEHEAGLAMDIGWIEDSFADSPAFEWLQQNCNEFGFIFRYRKETEDITGIAYEPWHYRYVGANHAKALEEAGVTLEEYVEGLEKEAGLTYTGNGTWASEYSSSTRGNQSGSSGSSGSSGAVKID